MCMVSKDVCNQIHLFYPYTIWSHLYTYIGFLHTRTSSTLTKKKRREPSVGNSGDIYNWSLSSLSSWASQLPPQPQNWLNCPNTTKSSFNQTNNGIKKWPHVVWCLCNIQYSSLDIDTAPHRWMAEAWALSQRKRGGARVERSQSWGTGAYPSPSARVERSLAPRLVDLAWPGFFNHLVRVWAPLPTKGKLFSAVISLSQTCES